MVHLKRSYTEGKKKIRKKRRKEEKEKKRKNERNEEKKRKKEGNHLMSLVPTKFLARTTAIFYEIFFDPHNVHSLPTQFSIASCAFWIPSLKSSNSGRSLLPRW